MPLNKKTNNRKAGIILHPTSLPGKWGVGDMGGNALKFIDMMADAGIRIWQILPLTPTGIDGCPYNSYSAFAGNELLIDIEDLLKSGLVPEDVEIPQFNDHRVDFRRVIDFKNKLIASAAREFAGIKKESGEFEIFKKDHAQWLDDYALFKTLTDKFEGRSWKLWPEEYRKRDVSALKKFASEHKTEINRY